MIDRIPWSISPIFPELDRRQAQPLLLNLGGARREAARHHAADFGPVAGVGKPATPRRL